MLNTMLGLRLDLVEEIVVRVLNFVHKADSLVIVDVVAVRISPTRGVWAIVFISPVVVIITSIKRLLLYMMIIRLRLVVVSIVMRDRVLIPMVQSPLVFSKMGLEQRLLLVIALVVFKRSVLDVNGFIHVVVTSMLEIPK